MSNDANSGSNIAEAAQAVAVILDKTPIYQDGLQPGVQELGKALQTVGKAINVVLAPVEAMVWGYEKVKHYVDTSLKEKLSGIPIDQIHPPKASIAVPTMEALRYTGSEPLLADMFANLLATSMTAAYADSALPCFVEMLKNISSDEAKIIREFQKKETNSIPVLDLSWLHDNQITSKSYHSHISTIGLEANCDAPENTQSYLQNLSRLGLFEIRYDASLADKNNYINLKEFLQVKAFLNGQPAAPAHYTPRAKEGVVSLTPLGFMFINCCLRLESQTLEN